MPDWRSAASLVRKIAECYHLPYYTISPTYSVCPEHGYIAGEHYTCPICGGKTEVYSRITGYYRPLQNWNDGKSEEFLERKTYEVDNGASSCAAEADSAPSAEKAIPCVIAGPTLVSTKTCPNCLMAKQVLNSTGMAYDVVYAEDNTELVRALGINTAPTLAIPREDGTVILHVNLSNIRGYALNLK